MDGAVVSSSASRASLVCYASSCGSITRHLLYAPVRRTCSFFICATRAIARLAPAALAHYAHKMSVRVCDGRGRWASSTASGWQRASYSINNISNLTRAAWKRQHLYLSNACWRRRFLPRHRLNGAVRITAPPPAGQQNSRRDLRARHGKRAGALGFAPAPPASCAP